MADYEFRYRLNNAPEARMDGSAQVAHDIDAVYRLQGSSDPWQALPAHHKTVLLPGDELSTLLGTGTNPEKVAAYIACLVDHHADPATPLNTNWNPSLMNEFANQNDVAVAAAGEADVFILSVTAGYPVVFSL